MSRPTDDKKPKTLRCAIYHPGPRATVHRSLAKQRSDFMTLAKAVHPEEGLLARRKARAMKSPALFAPGLSPLQQVARALVELGGRMTYFKLTKLLYLVDLMAIKKLGHMVAGEVYLRQVDGPWPPKLEQALKEIDGFEVRWFFARRVPMVDLGPSPRGDVQLDGDILQIIVDVYERYGRMSSAEIKAAVYRTAPMQYVLREERGGNDMRNKAILYKDKTIEESGSPGDQA